ncbi:MAG: acyl-CoA dehydrogenase [Acidobacteria bacterium RIFCSPHIGHO2_12_FULL_67_30]|nr:MAG: acyl-CoA dehydrogenase [Acidobacteria bacterium RIFCSPHIGHO2_12_FULL_67_30]
MAFQGVDFLEIDSLLTEDEKVVRAAVRQWVEENVKPVIEKHAQAGTFPMDLIPEVAKLGYFGANLKGYGCAEMSNVEYGLVMQELERGDSGLRSFVSVQSALVMYPIYAYGSKEQKEKWLPRLQKGEAIGCFGLTEPGFGSNPGGMLTTAKKDGDGYLLNGEKLWITNGSIADVSLVWAKDEKGDVGGYLVEKGTKGFKAWDVHDKYSLRASVTSGLAMSDCRIPSCNRLPDTQGLKAALSCLTQARYGIGWGGLGAAMECYETALNYAKERKQWANQPIASHQIVQEKLVWMLTEISKGQLLALQVGRLKDQNKANHAHISLLKKNNVWVALESARKARDILGANGITGDYPVFRHMVNLESVYTYEGTHDIHTLILGHYITGIPAYE